MEARTSMLGLVLGALSVSCGDGGGGDVLAPFQGSVLGSGRTLASLNDRSLGGAPSENDIVSVTGVRVTWVDQFDEVGNGSTVGNIFLQDFTEQAGPYQGITSFQTSYSPPSFRTSVGDVVDITGPYTEYQLDPVKYNVPPGWTLPEFNGGRLGLRFDAPYIPIVPVEIPVTDLLDYGTGRQWLSMVVTLKDVTFGGDGLKNMKPGDKGRATVDLAIPGSTSQPQVSNALFDLVSYVRQYEAQTGKTSMSGVRADITGIVSVAFRFQIAPRSADDIVIRAESGG